MDKISSLKPSGKLSSINLCGCIRANSKTITYNLWLPVNQVNSEYSYYSEAVKYWKQANFWNNDQIAVKDLELNKIFCFSKQISKSDIYAYNSSIPVKSPLIIFSHGFMAWASFYSYIIEDLVSNGFIVLGINHPSTSSISIANDIIHTKSLSHADLFASSFADNIQQDCIEDICILIDSFSKLPTLFLEKANTNMISLIGHSFGGSTALHVASFLKSKIKKVINLDGAIFGEKIIKKIDCPTLLLLGEESFNAGCKPGFTDYIKAQLEIDDIQATNFKEAYINRNIRVHRHIGRQSSLGNLPN